MVAAPLEPVILAEQGGLVVAERGAEILVVDRGNGPSEIVAFVLVIIALVFSVFGVGSLLSAGSAVSRTLSVAILALGICCGGALVRTVATLNARQLRPLTSFQPVAVFDRARRIYRDGAGEIVAPLDQVQFERRMQWTSSSPKLVAVTPSGVRTLKRGNPFGGGIGVLDRVLDDVVHRR